MIGNFLRAGMQGKFYEEKIRKALIINNFSIVGMFSLLYFGIKGIITQNLIYTIVVFSFFIFIIIVLIFFQIKKNVNFAAIAILSLMFILEVVLLLKLGENITGIFWFYLFPLLAFFMVGLKVGTFYSIGLIIITFILFKNPPEFSTKYPVELHERFVFTYLVTGILAFVFEYIRVSTFNAFMKADSQKTEYLEETLQQKEEIQTQADLLELKNMELLQFSIAASETDNSIIITDAYTNIEWVNKGFTKMLQYTLDEFKTMCPSLLKCSQNKELILKCINEKATISYQSYFILKDDTKIWVQSTVTPVLNAKNELEKLVVIETDISHQKLAEQEIREKNEELHQQRDEILSQKEALITQNSLISEKNEAIQKSISYAQTIQKSILPDLTELNNHFENFIIYYPKDIVSGDFYWYAKVDNYFYIAVVDCTGYGVPGAFMSILGSRILNEIVIYEKNTSPAVIFEKLQNQIYKTLHQKDSHNTDGMDLLMCKIDENQKDIFNITFSGAKRALIYFNSETKTIARINGTRKSIGGVISQLNTTNFENIELILPQNSILYLTTDGFIAQHNSLRKRIGSSNLMNIIELNSDKILVNQKQEIETFFKNWKDKQIQTDDVTIWTIKL